MISIYSFINRENVNLLSESTIQNFLVFSDDIVFGSNVELSQSQKEMLNKYNCSVIFDIDASNINLANIALKNTKGIIKVFLQLNEIIPIKQRLIWKDLAHILHNDTADSYIIPLLTEDMEYIQSKWFMHKNNCSIGCLISDTKILDDCFDLLNTESHSLASSKILPINQDILKNNTCPFVVKVTNDKT